MQITVRCFAAVREALGAETMCVELTPAATVADLKALLVARAPALARVAMVCAVNREYATAARVLADGDEVAFIPPISGGTAPELCRIDLTSGPIDPRALEAEVRTDQDGAVVTFTGVTRDHHDGRKVVSLAYEAYAEMVARTMVEIFEAALRQFEIGRVRVAHRMGEVPVGEASVVVVVAAPHRGPAFDACRFVMDRLKASVPIFKRERYAGDGETRWIGDLPAGQPEI